MRRFFTILNGTQKGQTTPIVGSVMIVGRTRTADLQIEDPLISRLHLEVRVESDQVFVSDKSTHGSRLNDKPLKGVVSLNPGDVLEIGHVHLRYEEAADEPVAEAAGDSADGGATNFGSAPSSTPGGTKAFNEPMDEGHGAHRPDATRPVVDGGTRMLNPSELPDWKGQPGKKKKSSPVLWAIISVLLLFGVFGALYWVTRRNEPLASRSNGTDTYNEGLFGFALDYPDTWGRLPNGPDILISWGMGGSQDQEWTRMDIYADRSPEYALTGLTDGFQQYRDTLRERRKDFSLVGSDGMEGNDVRFVFYRFAAAGVQGVGLYVLNGETRVVVECLSPKSCYPQQMRVFYRIFETFRLTTPEGQQFIDFPLPNAGLQQLALANPGLRAEQIDERKRKGDLLMANKDVKPDNLYLAVQEYKQACQLAIAGPERSASYPTVAKGLQKAMELFNQAVRNQRFEVSRALGEGDETKAYWAANKMMQMVPEKTDPKYQEAYRLTQRMRPLK